MKNFSNHKISSNINVISSRSNSKAPNSLGKKILIKTLNFEKLPKNLYNQNTFLNITKSKTNRNNNNINNINNNNIINNSSKRFSVVSGRNFHHNFLNKNLNSSKPYFMKPITSRNNNNHNSTNNATKTKISNNSSIINSGNVNKTITLNIIPKTTSHLLSNPHHSGPPNSNSIKPISRNKIKKNIFSNNLYTSYNNSSSTYRSFNKNNNSLQNLNLWTKISISKSSSRNKTKKIANFNNSSIYSILVNSKDSNNITINNNLGKSQRKIFFGNSIKNSTIFNSTSNNNNNINFNLNNNNNIFVNNNLSNNTFNKNNYSFNNLGGKFKRKNLLKKEEENLKIKEIKEKVNKIKFLKNFLKLKIYLLWKNYTKLNKKKHILKKIKNFINNNIIEKYYNKNIIKKYNKLLLLQLNNENIIFDQNNFETICKNYYKNIENLLNTNNIKADNNNNNFSSNISSNNSASNININNNNNHHYYNKILYMISKKILENNLNIISNNIDKAKIHIEYYFNNNNTNIIQKPNNSLLLTSFTFLNKIINKIKINQKFVKKCNNSINNIIMIMNENENLIKPIINKIVNNIKKNKNINVIKIEEKIVFNNIINDFNKIKYFNFNNNNNNSDFNYNNINEFIINLRKKIFVYFFDNNNNNNLNFIYKLKEFKKDIKNIENKLNDNNNNENFIKEINDIKKKISKIIENLETIFNENKINEIIENVSNNIKKVNINNKINLINIFDLINFKNENLLENNIINSIKNSNKIKELINNIFNSNNIDYLHIYKFIELLKNNINSKNDNNITTNNKNNFNLILYRNEISNILNKKQKTIFEKNIDGEIKTLDKSLNQVVCNIITTLMTSNKSIKFNNLEGTNSIDIYKKYITNKIKYKEVINPEIENYLYNNINNNNIYNNNNILKGNEKIILKKIKEEISLKNYNFNNNNTETISAFPYPKIFLLNNDLINKLNSNEKLSNFDINYYFNLINKNSELIINTNKNNSNRSLITGIKNFNKSKTEFEIFKFSTPISIPNQTNNNYNSNNSLNNKSFNSNNNNNNNLQYLSSLYKGIEIQISNSLTSQILTSLNTFSKKSFHSWINNNFSQISICTLNMIFTNEISNLLSEIDNTKNNNNNNNSNNNNKVKFPLKEFNLIINKYNQWLSEEIYKINNNIIRVNIAITILVQINIIENLIKNEVNDINSFNWLKYIRYLWDKNKKEVILECGGWANYQLKCLNEFNYKIFLTPDTDKIFLFNSSCFREKSASIIKIINNKYNNNSYKEIFEEFANLFWTKMIDIDFINISNNYNDIYITTNFDNNINNDNNNFKRLKTIFDIATVTKNWIFLNNLYENFPTSHNYKTVSLIVLSKFMQTIQQEVILNDIKYNDGEKMFCLMSCIEIDKNIKNKEEALKGSSRLLNFIKPDIEYYIKNSLKFNNEVNSADNIKVIINILLKYEGILRNGLKKFYFDFDFYNMLIIKIIMFKTKKNSESKVNINSFIVNYCKSFGNYFNNNNNNNNNNKDNSINNSLTNNNNINNNNNKDIINYFENNNILYNKECIELYNYLSYLKNYPNIHEKILIKGFGVSFIYKHFFNYYNFNKNNINNDINNNLDTSLVYFNYDNNNNKIVFDKIFDINYPKKKKLLRILIHNSLSKINNKIIINDENRLSILEFIHKVIKENINNNNNNLYCYKLLDFYVWLNKYIDIIKENKIDIKKIFNIIIQSLINTFNYNNINNKTILLNNIQSIFDKNFIKEFYNILNNNNNNNDYYLYDLINDKYIAFNNKEKYINYWNNFFKSNNIENYLFIINESYFNFNNLDNFNNNDNIIITDSNFDNDNYYKSKKKYKIYVGFENDYENINDINNKEINLFKNKYNIKTFPKKINVILNKIKINSIDEIKFIYSLFNNNFNELIDYSNFSISLFDIFNEIKILFKKFVILLKINNNKFLPYYLKYNFGFNNLILFDDYDNNNNDTNKIYFNFDNEDIKIKLTQEILLNEIYNKILVSDNKTVIDNINNNIHNINVINHHSSKNSHGNLKNKISTSINKSNNNNNTNLSNSIIKPSSPSLIIETSSPNKFNLKNIPDFTYQYLYNISLLINDIYNIKVEFNFIEKYNLFYDDILNLIKFLYPNFNSNIKSNNNNNFIISDLNNNNNNHHLDLYQLTLFLIEFLKFKENFDEIYLYFKSYSNLKYIFKENTNKLNEIKLMLDNSLFNYKKLINNNNNNNKNEFINSKYYYINFINEIFTTKSENKKTKNKKLLNLSILENLYENVYLSLSNHFLFTLLLTFELMKNNFEMTNNEFSFVLNYLFNYFNFPNDNIIKFNYENNENEIANIININGKKLYNFYNKNNSVTNYVLELTKKSLNNNNKYFYTSNIKFIKRDVDKLLYYITFIPEQSSSIFKYLINKYCNKFFNFGKYNVNNFLKRNFMGYTNKPITIKSNSSINVTNFLCSLSAYYEINFYIVRNLEFFNVNKNSNNINDKIKDFGYKYLIDNKLKILIKEGMERGYWIFICNEIDKINLCKILYEIHNNINEFNNKNKINISNNKKKLNENFKIFFDEKLIKNECKNLIENFTTILNIDNDNVDDLEAAHDIWVNVLEEKILTDSIMNATQKDILDIIENNSKNNINNSSFSINVINTNNNASIVSMKSFYNNNNINNIKNKKYNIIKDNDNDWNFLKNL